MGRLATAAAVLATGVDYLPPGRPLPKVSVFDALLPKSWSDPGGQQRMNEQKPLGSNVGRKTSVKYYEIKKDKNGKKSVIAHKSTVGSAAEDGNGKFGEAKKGDHGKNDGKKESGDGGVDKKGTAFTAEDDEKLKAMKAESQSWKNIATEMNRPQHELKARWKEIKDDNDGEDGGKEQKKKEGDGKQGDGAESKDHQQGKKDKKSGKKHESGKEGSVKDDGEVRFTMREWMTLQEDDLFSFGELQLLSELIMRDRDLTWLRIAGAFFDKTGRRVHQDDIREKFEEMAALT